MPDEVDVAGIARTLPYRDEEIQRAHDHLKLAIEAAAVIALSQNRTLDSAAYMVGSAIKAAASVPADTTETAMPPPFRRALVLRHPENARDSIPDWVEVDFEEIRKGDLFTLVTSDGTETGIAFAESDAKGEPPSTYGALLASELKSMTRDGVRTMVGSLRAEEHAILSMAVARLGGTVEGAPTARHNFLQRIDELCADEECQKGGTRLRPVLEEKARVTDLLDRYLKRDKEMDQMLELLGRVGKFLEEIPAGSWTSDARALCDDICAVGVLEEGAREAAPDLEERLRCEDRRAERDAAFCGGVRCVGPTPLDAGIGSVCPAGKGGHEPLPLGLSRFPPPDPGEPKTTDAIMEGFGTGLRVLICHRCGLLYATEANHDG